MNAYISLIGTCALVGRYMFARELLEASPVSAQELEAYRAKDQNLAGLPLIHVAAVYVRSTTRS